MSWKIFWFNHGISVSKGRLNQIQWYQVSDGQKMLRNRDELQQLIEIFTNEIHQTMNESHGKCDEHQIEKAIRKEIDNVWHIFHFNSVSCNRNVQIPLKIHGFPWRWMTQKFYYARSIIPWHTHTHTPSTTIHPNCLTWTHEYSVLPNKFDFMGWSAHNKSFNRTNERTNASYSLSVTDTANSIIAN